MTDRPDQVAGEDARHPEQVAGRRHARPIVGFLEDGQRLAMGLASVCGLAGVRQPVPETVEATRVACRIADSGCEFECLAQTITGPRVIARGPECPEVEQRLPLRADVASRTG